MNKKIIIGIVAGVVALGIIIAAIFGIAGKLSFSDSPTDSKQTTESTSESASGSDNTDKESGSAPAEDVKVGGGKVEVNSKKSGIISVPFVITNNPGIAAGQFVFEYDSSVLVYDSYDNGSLLEEEMVHAEDGKISYVSTVKDISRNATEDGTIITLNFKIKKNAPKGEYTIKVKESLFCDIDENIISAKLSDGKIIVD